jgi:hypothetical protein
MQFERSESVNYFDSRNCRAFGQAQLLTVALLATGSVGQARIVENS